MTYPAPQYPPQQAPAWPPAPQPQFGQPVYAPPPQYAPAPQYGAPQGYGQPPIQPPPPVLAQGTIDDFYNQPSTGGQFIKWGDYPGKSVVGPTARAITSADIRQITTPPNQGSVPQFYKDGRPKLEMLVPIRVQPTQENPEGIVVWPVKGADRDELARAMAEAGAPEGPPEHNCFLQITFTELRPTKGGIAQKVKRVHYTRPGEQPVAANHQIVQPMQYAQPPAMPQPQQVQQAASAAFYAAAGQPAQVPTVYAPPQPDPAAQYAAQQVAVQQPQYAPPAQPQPMPQPAAPAPAAQPAQPQLAMPADFSPEQQALMAHLTKQQQG